MRKLCNSRGAAVQRDTWRHHSCAQALATSLGIAILIDPSVADAYFETAQYALLGVANNFFAATGSGYAAGGPAALEYNPLTHTWSLGVEGESRNL